MHNIRPFEIVLIGVFIIFAVIGLAVLSTWKGGEDPQVALYGDKVEIWGTLDKKVMTEFLDELKRVDKAFLVVSYVEKDPRSFENELLNAIAEGRSPDLVILPHNLLMTYRTKLQPISYETIDTRTFKSRYIDGAEIFMRSDGIYGVPFGVDPLVMYWNRDIFSSSGLANPPTTWETLISQTTPAVTRMNEDGSITQSAIALGEYTNIAHAKDIIAMLLLQAGSTLVEEHDGTYSVTLNKSTGTGLAPGDAVLSFYTQFAIPTKDTYSWNRSLYLDRTEFSQGTLGLYFGKGSERVRIERENANLNFDIAQIPQGSGVSTERNYGDFYAFSIPRASKNAQGAFAVALALSSPERSKLLTHLLSFAPADRSLYTGSTGDSFEDVVYRSALIARGWLDPSPGKTNTIFQTMIEQGLVGQSRTKNIIIDVVQELENLLR